MSAGVTKIVVKIGANSCGANALRGMPECARDATSRQAVQGERVALHRPDGKSLDAHTFVGTDSCNPCAGNDMQTSAARTANSLSGNVLAVNSLRRSGWLAGGEKAAQIGKNLMRTSTLVRWCKFNLVGAVGILVQFGVLFLLKSVLHFNYLAATGFAVEAAVVHNFFWHERFTWGDRTRLGRKGFGRNPSGAKARNLLSSLFAALKRCATQKRATQECATQECVTEAGARAKSKAAGKSARSTQTQTHKVIEACTGRTCSGQECRRARRKCATRKLDCAGFRRFLRFNFTNGLISIGGNLEMMRVMVGRWHMNYLAANGVAIAVCSLVNFVVSDGWVFGRD
jgi:putative flippase GtrA